MEKLITFSSCNTTKWSGGTTTELYIFPEAANFSNGDYETRISLAKVDLEESTFTKLADVERTLTVLEGNHLLSVNNLPFVPIGQYSPVSFKGDDLTKSKGSALNFNFMKKTSKPHEVSVMQNGAKERLVLLPKFENALLFIIEGNAKSRVGDLKAKDSLFFDEEVVVILEAETLFIKVDF